MARKKQRTPLTQEQINAFRGLALSGAGREALEELDFVPAIGYRVLLTRLLSGAESKIRLRARNAAWKRKKAAGLRANRTDQLTQCVEIFRAGGTWADMVAASNPCPSRANLLASMRLRLSKEDYARLVALPHGGRKKAASKVSKAYAGKAPSKKTIRKERIFVERERISYGKAPSIFALADAIAAEMSK